VQVLDATDRRGLVRAGVADGDLVAGGQQLADRRRADETGSADERDANWARPP